MFKDYDKYLSTSLKVYLFLLVCCFIMKLVGLNYFGLDLNNKTIVSITNFVISKKLLDNFILFIPLIFNQYVIVSFTCNDNSKKMLIYNLVLLVPFYFLQCYKIDLFGNWCVLVEELYFITVCYIYNKKVSIKRFLFITVLMMVAQLLSIITRYNYTIEYIQNPFANIILNLDYLIMLVIIYKLNFMKGGKLWEDGYQVAQYSSLQMKNHFINLQKEYQKSSSNFKQLEKQEKATVIIYSILSLFWNIFTLVVVLFIAKLNDTFIECVFIITSFWLSKKVFGKPFHLKSMLQCFILSNLTYYILNRITTPTGISILIPIMLGVGLSYITSKLVKKNYKPLYKGMPKEVFEDTILKVTDKDSVKYQICYDYFVGKQNAVYLGHKYNYTEAGIRKITSRVNDNIKAL